MQQKYILSLQGKSTRFHRIINIFGLIAMGYCAGLENGYKKALEDLKKE